MIEDISGGTEFKGAGSIDSAEKSTRIVPILFVFDEIAEFLSTTVIRDDLEPIGGSLERDIVRPNPPVVEADGCAEEGLGDAMGRNSGAVPTTESKSKAAGSKFVLLRRAFSQYHGNIACLFLSTSARIGNILPVRKNDPSSRIYEEKEDLHHPFHYPTMLVDPPLPDSVSGHKDFAWGLTDGFVLEYNRFDYLKYSRPLFLSSAAEQK